MPLRGIQAVQVLTLSTLTVGGLGGCAWLSGFDGDDYAVAADGGAGGVGAASTGGLGGMGASGTGGSGAGQGGTGADEVGGFGTGAGPTGGGGSGGTTPTCVDDIHPGPENRVFVLHDSVTGNFGSVVAGDSICTAAAEACLGGGTWMAYLSDANEKASDRLPMGNAPWHLLDGNPVFMDHVQLTTGPFEAIDIDEFGREIQQGPVWTGTLETGEQSTLNCGNWGNGAGSFGQVTGSNGTWSDTQMRECNMPARLYCFEID